MAKASLILGLAAVFSIAALRSPQAPEWRVMPSLSDADKAAVLALASKVQLAQAAVVSSDVIHQPLGCDALRIESTPAIVGNRRSWERLWVMKAGFNCRMVQPDSPRVGEWIVAEPKKGVGAWRVANGAGFIDAETPSTIPQSDVASIIAAIRSGRLINRLPPEYRVNSRQIPKVDAAAIIQVWNHHPDPDLYDVHFRMTNVVFVVAVRGTAVELRGWKTEIA